MLAQPDPQKKICFQESFSVFPGRSRYRRARCSFGSWRALAENRNFEKRAREERTQKQQQAGSHPLEPNGRKGTGNPKLFATPGTIRRGETVQLCYGVANAKTVKLEPQSNPVWPSYSRCVDVIPLNHTYTLTIADAAATPRVKPWR